MTTGSQGEREKKADSLKRRQKKRNKIMMQSIFVSLCVCVRARVLSSYTWYQIIEMEMLFFLCWWICTNSNITTRKKRQHLCKADDGFEPQGANKNTKQTNCVRNEIWIWNRFDERKKQIGHWYWAFEWKMKPILVKCCRMISTLLLSAFFLCIIIFLVGCWWWCLG